MIHLTRYYVNYLRKDFLNAENLPMEEKYKIREELAWVNKKEREVEFRRKRNRRNRANKKIEKAKKKEKKKNQKNKQDSQDKQSQHDKEQQEDSKKQELDLEKS